MRRLALFAAVLALAATAACGPRQPLSQSEFAGFCYQQSSGPVFCDNISICDAYTVVMEMPQGSQSKCEQACNAIYQQQLREITAVSYCSSIANGGNNLCVRYCRDNYPK